MTMGDTAPLPLTADCLRDASGVRHAFFTRIGGVSGGLYASLNVGFGSDDVTENVQRNRERALAALGGAEALNTVYQIHGREVAVADAAWAPAAAPKADAMVTNKPGLAIGILTADCAPVLFADPDRRVVGAAHAGWRGAVGGVLAATVTAMEQLGARRGSIRAVVGPTIAQGSYEVGPEFPASFLAESPDNQRFFRPSTRAGHHMFDLAGYVASRLAALEIGAADVLARDTCAEEELFFSYRRSTLRKESDYGRELSAIVIEP
jgi:purine-nucleoside/S-methyl-5'-thioadenosine phosphorylase / adenosine deaminase